MRIHRCSAGAVARAAVLSLAMTSPFLMAQADGSSGKASMPMPPSSMNQSKMSGMQGMDGMSMTGDADYDFAVNMKMHHSMALDMAKAEINNGKNPEMLKMARSIVSSQSKEIATFDRWLASHPKPKQEGMSMPK